jgi:hypothetical protein
MRYHFLLLVCLAVASCASSPPAATTSNPVADPYPGSGGKFFGTPSFLTDFDASKFSAFQVGATTMDCGAQHLCSAHIVS